MINHIKLGSIALLLAASAFPALAQDTSSQASSSSSEASSAMSSSASSSPSSEQPAADVNYGQIISAIQAGKMADLTTITETSTVNIVLMSDIMANGGDLPALQNALEKNAEAATIKANVDTNATLKAKVTEAGYTTDLVVAVLANDDGSFTVVINDQRP